METVTVLEKDLSSNEYRKKTAIGLIHRVYLCHLKNSRNYTASTKTKSEVRGGGRKPWRQKGTGRARAGSLRSPLFVGGGVIFGPKPRIVSKKINKKEKRLATLLAFYFKKKQCILIEEKYFDSFNSMEQVKTKEISNLIGTKNLPLNTRILFILSKPNKFFWLASRNLKNVEVTTANCVNLEQFLKATSIFLSPIALKLIESTYGMKYE